MDKNTPKISVIMSVFNSEKYLKEAVDSILEQTFTDFEFIITDDCSTDSSLAILEEYAKKDNRIILLKNSENIGLTKNLNKMIDIAKGKYIARMDADDISLPKRFQIQYNFMEENSDIGVCGSNIGHIGTLDKVSNHPLNHNEIKIGLLFKCVMMHPTIVVRKNIITKARRSGFFRIIRARKSLPGFFKIIRTYEKSEAPKSLKGGGLFTYY